MAIRSSDSSAIGVRAVLWREAWTSGIWLGAALLTGVASGLAVRPLLRVPGLVRALEQLPVPIPAILGVSDLSGPERLRDLLLFGMVGPLLFLSFAIGVGSRGAGARHRPSHGTARLDQGRPPDAGQARLEMVSMAAVIVAIAVALAAGATLGAALGHVALDPARLLTAVAADALLGLSFGAVTLAIALATGWPALANWAVTGLAVAADAGNSLASAVGSLLPLRYVSPVYYAESGHPLERGVSTAHLSALALGVVLAVGIALAAATSAARRSDSTFGSVGPELGSGGGLGSGIGPSSFEGP